MLEHISCSTTNESSHIFCSHQPQTAPYVQLHSRHVVHGIWVQACLTKNPKERPSAEELLHHDWLVRQLEADTAGIPEVRPYHSACWTHNNLT